jgi:hypothetical protein
MQARIARVDDFPSQPTGMFSPLAIRVLPDLLRCARADVEIGEVVSILRASRFQPLDDRVPVVISEEGKRVFLIEYRSCFLVDDRASEEKICREGMATGFGCKSVDRSPPNQRNMMRDNQIYTI